MSTAVDDTQQASGTIDRAFPATMSHLFAVLALSGVEPGDRIEGRWYQLSVADAPPEGTLVSETTVDITQDDVTAERKARITLSVSTNSGTLPEGDWVLRINVNDVFVRTAGFVITHALDGAGARPETYVVQNGDSFRSIAEAFRGPTETVEQFVQRLVTLNNIQAGAALQVGQVLQVPPAQ